MFSFSMDNCSAFLCEKLVLSSSFRSPWLSSPWLNDLEGAKQALIYIHQCPSIVEFSAVIWCREDCNQLPFCEELVSIFHYLQVRRTYWCHHQENTKANIRTTHHETMTGKLLDEQKHYPQQVKSNFCFHIIWEFIS